ncbi:MAG TPA: alpha/beta hydrolase, partial [Phycisphaerae bacterium]|nr:alpha/beta hydrolase [Phycisphaerae bacterium]
AQYGDARATGLKGESPATSPEARTALVEGKKLKKAKIRLKREDVDPGRIAIHGRSLGGGVAAQIAARRKPAALILESTFTSVASYAQKYCVPKLLVRHPFRTDLVLPELDVPVLVFHGTRDDIVPVKHGRRLAKLARNAVYVEYDCGHNDAPGPGNEADYWGRIEAFLEEAGITRPTAAQAVD